MSVEPWVSARVVSGFCVSCLSACQINDRILLANSPEVEQVGEAVVSGFGLSLLEIAFRSLARRHQKAGCP